MRSLRFILLVSQSWSKLVGILMLIEIVAMYDALTIRTYVNGQWHDALSVMLAKRSERCRIYS